MSVEITSQALELDKQQLEFHPLVKLELHAELRKWLSTLEQAPTANIERIQGRVSILRWILEKMPDEILAREREKAKEQEGKE